MGISLSGLTESSTGNLTLSAGSNNDVLIGNGSTQIFVSGLTDTLGIGGTAVTGSRLNIETGAIALDFITSTGTAFNIVADTVNDTSGSATLAIVPTVQVGIMTYTASNAMTYTNTASVYIAGIPVASTNVTFTNPAYALWVDNGAVRFDDRTFWIGGIAYEFPANNGSASEFLQTDGSGNLSWSSVASASVATTVTVTDNEATNENNLIPFVANAATATGNHGLEMDGDFTYSPNTGRVTATQLAGTLQTAAQGNITSVGTLSSLTTSGDVTVGDDLLLTDGKFVRWGGGSGDTRIYGHAGNNLITFVTAGAESFRITGGATPTMTFAGSVDITTSSGNLTLAPGGNYVISTKSMEIDVASGFVLTLRDGSNNDVVTFDSLTSASGAYAPGRIVSLPDTINLTTGAGSNTMNTAFGSAFKPGILTFTATNATSTWAEGPATVYIAGPPVAGSNVVFTAGAYALWVDSGNSRFDGNVNISVPMSDNTVTEVARIEGTTSSAAYNSSLVISSSFAGSTAANRWIDLSVFDHNPTARALVLQKAGGNVGINETAPSWKLTAKAPSNAAHVIVVENPAGTRVVGIGTVDNGDGWLNIRDNAGNIEIGLSCSVTSLFF